MADIIVPRRKQEWFDKEGNFTHQAFRFFEELANISNETTSTVASAGFISSMNAQIQQLRKESDGLPEFTMDTTGFTMDSTEFSMDKVIS